MFFLNSSSLCCFLTSFSHVHFFSHFWLENPPPGVSPYLPPSTPQPPRPPPLLPRMWGCWCLCAYSEKNGLLSPLLPRYRRSRRLTPQNKASAIVIICIDAYGGEERWMCLCVWGWWWEFSVPWGRVGGYAERGHLCIEMWAVAGRSFFFSTSHKLAFHPRGGGAEGDKGLSLPRSESRTEQGQLACRSGLCRAVRLFLWCNHIS